MILCEKILGSMADPAFADCQADYVEIEWHEAYKKASSEKRRVRDWKSESGWIRISLPEAFVKETYSGRMTIG